MGMEKNRTGTDGRVDKRVCCCVVVLLFLADKQGDILMGGTKFSG